jgi:hypothetical protein
LRQAFAFAVAGARDIHLIVPRPFALQAQRLADLAGKALQAGNVFIGEGKFPYRVDLADRLRQRIDLAEDRALILRQRLRPVAGADHMPGGLFIKHRIIHIRQAMDLLFGEHGRQAYRLRYRHRIGCQNLFCVIIIQMNST